MVAPRSLPSPVRLESQPTSGQCLASPTRKRPISTSTTSMPTTAASRNGCAPSMASRRRTCPITLAGAAFWRLWAKRSCPTILSSGLSDSAHINNQRHKSLRIFRDDLQRLVPAEQADRRGVDPGGIGVENNRCNVEAWLIVLRLLAQLMHAADHPAGD